MNKLIYIKEDSNQNLPIARGFTLVELIVSMALFTIVVFITTSAFLSVVDLNKKARITRVVLDNFSVALEQMVRNIRTGDTYRCLDASSGSGRTNEFWNGSFGNPTTDPMPPRDCSSATGGRSMLFYLPDDTQSAGIATTGYYLRNLSDGSNPYRIQGRGGGTCCSYLTEPEIKITSLRFYVTGSSSVDSKQPRVNIVVQGYVADDPDQTKFSIYTSVTQRAPKF